MKRMASVVAFGAIMAMLITAVPVSSKMLLVLKPDLKVVRNSVIAIPPERNSITIVARVTNTGRRDAGPFKVRVYYTYSGMGRRKIPVHEFDVAGLTVGEVKSLSFDQRYEYVKGRSQHWEFVVDCDDQINESNETNNSGWGDYP